MRLLRAQDATRLSLLRSSTYCPLVGQGATEYLVLLAVVLIVALVSVALLGFFPGMASDAQITQSQAYWQSSQPIAVIEAGARNYLTYSFPYIRIRNSGAYPIRMTKMLGAGGSISGVDANGMANISDYYYMAPGEEKYFANIGAWGVPAQRYIYLTTGSPTNSSSNTMFGLSSTCQNSSASPGMMVMKDFGFEYIEYIEGQQITKRQVGSKPLIVKCREPY